MPVSERPVLGMATASGEIQLYKLMEPQVTNHTHAAWCNAHAWTVPDIIKVHLYLHHQLLFQVIIIKEDPATGYCWKCLTRC